MQITFVPENTMLENNHPQELEVMEPLNEEPDTGKDTEKVTQKENLHDANSVENGVNSENNTDEQLVETEAETSNSKGVLQMILEPFTLVYKGWPIYVRQKIVFAGMALSGLYMTVIGFDSISIGKFQIEMFKMKSQYVRKTSPPPLHWSLKFKITHILLIIM